MSKAKLFMENILVYGFGGIMSKMIPLLILPIITRLMPGTEYLGLSDLEGTVVSFASALSVIGMYDAMYRMFFEKTDINYKKEICSTTLFFTIVMSAVVFTMMLVLKNVIARYFFGNIRYVFLVELAAVTTFVSATNSIISAPTRMQNKRGIFLVTNIVSSMLSYTIAIPLILRGYYVIALPIAGLIAGASVEIAFFVINHEWFSISKVRKSYLPDLLKIAIPLFPNFLIYWIFNSSDRVMITNIMNVEAAGIYSVGSKLGHASQLIYTAFAGGWQFFAFSTMKEDNQVESNSKIFEYLGLISFAATVIICIISYYFFKIVFAEQYLKGYVIAPYLFLAPLLQMLFQIAGNQFLVVKKTWPNMPILLSGAVINVCLNLILIPKIGIEGAAVATLIGYILTDVLCVAVLVKMKLMIISFRFVYAVVIMIGFFLTWRFVFRQNIALGLMVAIITECVYVWLYRCEIRSLFKRICKRRN